MIAASHSTVPSRVRLDPYPASLSVKKGCPDTSKRILLACIKRRIVLQSDGRSFDHRDRRSCVSFVQCNRLSTSTSPGLIYLVSILVHYLERPDSLSQRSLHFLLHSLAVHTCTSMHGNVRAQLRRCCRRFVPFHYRILVGPVPRVCEDSSHRSCSIRRS